MSALEEEFISVECDEQRKKNKGNLEQLLDNIYKAECEFQIKQDEITFIQTGIETLVEQIVKKVHGNISVKEWKGVKICEPDIIKVGSFYEGTRNKYPDEFDFIYVFCEQIEEYSTRSRENLIYALNVEFERSFQPVCMFYQIKGTLQCQTDTKEIVFGGYVKKHGPAHLLKFLYHKESGETRCINVDLVPAARVECSPRNFQTLFQDLIEAHNKKVPRERGYLFVGNDVSSTDAEIYFMKNELSENHVKVYRIIKYLINGHGDNEKLEETYIKYEIPANVYSSFMIKCEVIEHHDELKDSDTKNIGSCENIGSCVVNVLDRINEKLVFSSKHQEQQNAKNFLTKMIKYMAYNLGREVEAIYEASFSVVENMLVQKQSLSRCIYTNLIASGKRKIKLRKF